MDKAQMVAEMKEAEARRLRRGIAALEGKETETTFVPIVWPPAPGPAPTIQPIWIYDPHRYPIWIGDPWIGTTMLTTTETFLSGDALGALCATDRGSPS